MITFWMVVSIILGIIWLIVLGIGIWYFIANPDNNHPEDHMLHFRVYAASMAGALLFVVAHWIVLLLAVPLFFIYGVWSGVRLLFTKPWKETVE